MVCNTLIIALLNNFRILCLLLLKVHYLHLLVAQHLVHISAEKGQLIRDCINTKEKDISSLTE